MAYCRECRRHFPNRWALQQHLDNSLRHRRGEYYCDTCDEHFDDEYDLRQHDEINHYSRSSSEYDSSSDEQSSYWCYDCSKSFRNEHDLRQHERSTAHLGQNIECPYCTRTFRIEMDVVKHMEAGTCEGGMNRLKVDRRVLDTDTSRLFTSPMVRRSRRGRLVYMEEEDVWARDDAWNGYAFQCPHCKVTHDKLGALNGHITSKHFPTRSVCYQCCGDNCDRTFMFFSQLMGHLEDNTRCDARDYCSEELDGRSLFEWVNWYSR